LPEMDGRVELRSRDEKRRIMRSVWEPIVHFEEVLVDGEPVSHVASIQLDMRVGSSVVRMGGIAGVETKPEYRMRGFARKCMTRTIRYMHDHGCDVSMLFGIPNFYTKFGYAPCLPEHTLTVRVRDAEEAGRLDEYKVREFTEEDIDSVLEIFNENNRERTCTIVRKRGEWMGFRRGKRPGYPPPALVWEEGDEVVAYVSFHRFMDPDRDYTRYDYEFLVTEIGMKERRVFSTILKDLAAKAMERRFEYIRFSLPLDHPFTEYCHRFGSESVVRYRKDSGGMMRIINQRTLFQKIEDELQRRVKERKVENVQVEVKTELASTEFRVRGRELSVSEGNGKGMNRIELPQSILTQLVVGYRSVQDVVNDWRVKVRGNVRLLEALFPKSFPYMWVLDRF